MQPTVKPVLPSKSRAWDLGHTHMQLDLKLADDELGLQYILWSTYLWHNIRGKKAFSVIKYDWKTVIPRYTEYLLCNSCLGLTMWQALCRVKSPAEPRTPQALKGPWDSVSHSDDGWKILSPFKMWLFWLPLGWAFGTWTGPNVTPQLGNDTIWIG